MKNKILQWIVSNILIMTVRNIWYVLYKHPLNYNPKVGLWPLEHIDPKYFMFWLWCQLTMISKKVNHYMYNLRNKWNLPTGIFKISWGNLTVTTDSVDPFKKKKGGGGLIYLHQTWTVTHEREITLFHRRVMFWLIKVALYTYNLFQISIEDHKT